MLPNVVIAGAPKCGTTSLFAWLADHPDVCGSNVKEARYVLDPGDPLFDENSNFRDHGLAGYEAYFRQCEAEKAKVVLEATPVYLYQATAPEALARIEPKPQIVFVSGSRLRVSPRTSTSYATVSFASRAASRQRVVRLVEAGDPRIPDYAHANTALSQSRYADYLPAWLARFPRSSIHFFLLENSARPTCLCKGGGGPRRPRPGLYDTYAFGRKNATYRIRRPWLHLARRAVGRRLSPGTRRRLKAATAGAYARINVEPVRFGQAGTRPTSCASSTGRSPRTTRGSRSSRGSTCPRGAEAAVESWSRRGYRQRWRTVLPNAVLAGAPKSGASSLFRWLADHPEVCGSSVKETRFLLDPDDCLFQKNSNVHEHGLSGYERYFDGCDDGPAKVVLEATRPTSTS